jgi:hypothetical protein
MLLSTKPNVFQNLLGVVEVDINRTDEMDPNSIKRQSIISDPAFVF